MPVFRRSLPLVLALGCIGLIRAAQEAAPTFTILITAKQDVAQSASELRVSVLLTNTSDHPINVYMDKRRAAELSGYLIDVRDSQGRIPRTSRYYRQIYDPSPKDRRREQSNIITITK